MVVKSDKVIVNLLLDDGYIFDEDGLTCEGKPTFCYEMFELCGEEPPSGLFWDPDWIERSPTDCLGRICSVWDDDNEPSDEERCYERVISYSKNSGLSFRTLNSPWKSARPISADDLVQWSAAKRKEINDVV